MQVTEGNQNIRELNMGSFFRFILRIVKWLFVIFTALLLGLWLSGALQDRELIPEVAGILNTLEELDVPAEENRFYYLTGFESPSSYEPQVWGKKVLDEQKRFYDNPENRSRDFDFYQEQDEFKNSVVRARLLQGEIAGYSEIWEGVSDLFSSLDSQSFPAGLLHYFSSLENHSGSGIDLVQGKRDMFVKRYKHVRSMQQSRPVVLEHIKESFFTPWSAIKDSHKHLLLDACNRFLDDEQMLYVMDMILDEIILDMSALQQWYRTSGDLLESMVVRVMLVDSMDVSVFLLQTAKREGVALHGRDRLFTMVSESGELLNHYIPRKVIAQELNTVDLRINSWARSQKDLDVFIDVMDEMMEDFGATYQPPMLARVLMACPERLYPVVLNLLLKVNHTKNLAAEGFVILLNPDEMAGDSEEVKQLLDEQEHSADSLLNYLYNPLGMNDLSGLPGDSGYSSHAKILYNYLYSEDRRRKVKGITEKLRTL